ncbi:FAD/NAD(P)-binding domain-containing protein [Stipitochalara longipes BDJ]|nr:FAD/NAD(P)-binding domain-containing protein [Stipitochalara longipes BDJ]
MLELDIIIVGAGITGLASAIALSRAGHNVQILERSSFKRDAGFMITLSVPANRVLESFDFDFKRARSTDCDFINVYDGKTLTRWVSWSTRGYTGKPNDQVRSLYRADLHDELKRLALLQSGEWKTPTLTLGVEVVSVDIHNATVHLKDGSSLSADVIIGADGERSLIRSAFANTDPLSLARIRTLRAMIPTELLLDGSEMQAIYETTKSNFSIFAMPDHRALVWYEGRDGLLQDLECNYPLHEGEDLRAELDDAKAKEKVLERFGDYHPGIVKALRQATRVSDWELWHGTGVFSMQEGSTLLVGDAAHSMLPFTGQGGGQGIEDAGALAVLFRDIESKKEIGERLRMVEEVRRERTAIFQSMAGVKMGTEEKFARENPGHLIHRTNVRSAEGHLEFMSDYNVIDESEKVLAEYMKAKVNT